MRKKSLLTAGLLSAAVLAMVPVAESAPAGVRVGTLTCNVAHGWGHVITSSRRLDCEFHPNHRQPERYIGALSKYGVDIGYTRGGALVWEVIAPSSDVRPGALEGNYGGASVNATV